MAQPKLRLKPRINSKKPESMGSTEMFQNIETKFLSFNLRPFGEISLWKSRSSRSALLLKIHQGSQFLTANIFCCLLQLNRAPVVVYEERIPGGSRRGDDDVYSVYTDASQYSRGGHRGRTNYGYDRSEDYGRPSYYY